MKLKVCGMRDPENIQDILDVGPDFIGFIFYDQSPRYAGNLEPKFVHELSGIKKVGVFVNEQINEILRISEEYQLDLIQLHGYETEECILLLQNAGLGVIKVFRVDQQLPDNLESFRRADYWLFDTKSSKYGGTGKQFNWDILERIDHPFLLSGGVGVDDIATIKAMNLSHLTGVDVNSKAELKPGLKNVELVKQIKAQL